PARCTASDASARPTTATRSLPLHDALPISNACTTASFANDGAPTTAASSRVDSGLTTNTCYRWVVSINDNAGNTGSATSGTVLVYDTPPTVPITQPTGNTTQNTTSVTVSWT